ncbi:MAG: TetR/AcrR family transcriptional regulator [Myxococcales bacterium]|nr:TetR/AcrR family transcriptional regulator [Myxococcales bacterium]
MPRPSNTDARREQIVLGLQRVMAERGYEKATVSAIAQAAGLTPGLVHYHFKNKQEILLELLARLGRVWRARAATVDEGAPRERLEKLINAWLARDRSADPGAVACWVALGAEALRQPQVRAPYDEVVREALARLEEGVELVLEAEARPTGECRAIAAGLMAAMQGYLQLGVANPDSIPRGSAARTVIAMAHGALDAQVTQPEGRSR